MDRPQVAGFWQNEAGPIAIANRGQCVEAVWPYNPNPPCNNHGPLPTNARPNGLHYKLQITGLSNGFTECAVDQERSCATNRPAGISIPVYNRLVCLEPGHENRRDQPQDRQRAIRRRPRGLPRRLPRLRSSTRGRLFYSPQQVGDNMGVPMPLRCRIWHDSVPVYHQRLYRDIYACNGGCR